MKICCMIASLRMGGAERQLAGLAAMLKQAGHDVEVLTYRDGDFYEAGLIQAGVPHRRVVQDGSEAKLIRDIATGLKSRGVEVLISFLAGTNIKACLVRRLYPELRLIVSERNANTSYLLHDRLRFAIYQRFASQVVSNNYSQTEFIRRHAPALQGRLYTIPNFTELDRFCPNTAKPPRHDDLFRFVVTARLSPRKNALGLIKAAARCPEIRIDWFGSAKQDAYYKRCLRAISAHGLNERFFIHPGSDCPENLYRQADAFCLPSFYEGTSNSLAEALACGLPAACSNVSDNPRYVTEGRNGVLFDPSDTDSIAGALKRMSSLSPEELAGEGERSRETALSSFSKEAFISRYEDLLRGPKGGTKSHS